MTTNLVILNGPALWNTYNGQYKWLFQVSDYKAPNFEAGGTMQQGMYVPKGFIWEADFDPLYVALRAMHRRDFQQSMDRYTTQ